MTEVTMLENNDELDLKGSVGNPLYRCDVASNTADPRIRKALNAYLRFHPEENPQQLSMGQLVSWLFHAGSMSYIEALEQRLDRIRTLIDGVGIIDLEKPVAIKPMTILEIRVICQVDPSIKPARLRKRRRLSSLMD